MRVCYYNMYISFVTENNALFWRRRGDFLSAFFLPCLFCEFFDLIHELGAAHFFELLCREILLPSLRLDHKHLAAILDGLRAIRATKEETALRLIDSGTKTLTDPDRLTADMEAELNKVDPNWAGDEESK
jgi:hypothetical protein